VDFREEDFFRGVIDEGDCFVLDDEHGFLNRLDDSLELIISFLLV